MGRDKKNDIEQTEPTNSDRKRDNLNEDNKDADGPYPEPDPSPFRHEVPIAVVEQRVSNLSQGSMCLVLLTGPFLHVLHLIPRGVLAGLLLVTLYGSYYIVN